MHRFHLSRLRELILFSALFFNACGGVSGTDDPQLGVSASGAFRSLRLGQSSSPTSPVAVSAAIDTRESLVILNSSPASSLIAHVLYKGASGAVARITVDNLGRPTSAATADANVIFANYTATTVDLQIEVAGILGPITTTTLSNTAIELLNAAPSSARQGRETQGESTTLEVLRGGVLAAETFGCSGRQLAGQGEIPNSFTFLANEACESRLVDAVQEVVEEGDVDDRFVPDIEESSSCDFDDPDWIDNFSNAESCAGIVGDDLVEEVFEEIEEDLEEGDSSEFFDQVLENEDFFPEFDEDFGDGLDDGLIDEGDIIEEEFFEDPLPEEEGFPEEDPDFVDPGFEDPGFEDPGTSDPGDGFDGGTGDGGDPGAEDPTTDPTPDPAPDPAEEEPDPTPPPDTPEPPTPSAPGDPIADSPNASFLVPLFESIER